jgi:hypothetical protein
MAPMRFSIGLVLALALCACNSTQGTATASKPKLFGLISGDLPPAKEFVVETRSPSADYPAVGVTPPPRTEKVLTPAERASLEAELKAAAGGSTPVKKRKKPVVPQ